MELSSQLFAGDSEDFPNPERGWTKGEVALVDDSPYDSIRTGPYTMTTAVVVLKPYRATTVLPDSFLVALDTGLRRVRDAGIKIVLRFAYNNYPECACYRPFFDPTDKPDADCSRYSPESLTERCADAPKEIILAHIRRLAPVIATHAPVIAAVQAGFVGPWGEWHHSAYGTDSDPPARREILQALLEALPSSRMVQVRRPAFKQALFSDPLMDSTAFTGSPQARLAHHNDCFLAPFDDEGTYAPDSQGLRAYLASDSGFVVVGGETCMPNRPHSDGPSAIEEMERFHWSLLNSAHSVDVIAGWVNAGYHDEISRRLGYRLVLDEGKWTPEVAPSGLLRLEVNLHNAGFAAPFNERLLFVVLERDDFRRMWPIEQVDLREWRAGPISFQTEIPIPADAGEGRYTLALWLPDNAPSLRDDPRYSIRFANAGVWREEQGDNVLTRELTISSRPPSQSTKR